MTRLGSNRSAAAQVFSGRHRVGWRGCRQPLSEGVGWTLDLGQNL